MSFKGGLKRCNFYMKPGEKLRMPRVMYVYWEGEPEDFDTTPSAEPTKLCRLETPTENYVSTHFPCPDENATNGEMK